MTSDVARTGLFAAVLIVLAGYIFIFRPLEATVADRYGALDAARAQLERSLALARRVPALAGERSALERGLGRVHVHDPRVALVARFLRNVAGISGRESVSVQSVAADNAQALVTTTSPKVPLLDDVALEVTLRGRYGNVIRAVRELDRGDVATRITLASLGAADRRPGAPPDLNAAFHVQLLREADEVPMHAPLAQ